MGLIAHYFPYDTNKLTPTGSGVTISSNNMTSTGSEGVKSTTNITVGAAATWSVTFKLKELKGTHLIDARTSASGSDAGLQPIYLYMQGDGATYARVQFYSAKNSGTVEFEYPKFAVDTLYTITVRANNTSCSAFINGSPLNRTSPTAGNIPSFNAGSYPLYIGTRFERYADKPNRDTSINGTIYDVRIYDHMLSDEHIRKLAQSLSTIDTFNPYITTDNSFHTVNIAQSGTANNVRKNHAEFADIVENEYTYIDYGNTGKSSANYIIVQGDKYFDTGIKIENDAEYWLEYDLEYLTIQPDDTADYYNQIMGITGNRGLGIGTEGNHIWESDHSLTLKANKPYHHRWYLNTKTHQFYREVGGYKTCGDMMEASVNILNTIIQSSVTFKFFASSHTWDDINSIAYKCNCKLLDKITLTVKKNNTTTVHTYTVANLIDDKTHWYNMSKQQLTSPNVTYGQYAKYLKIFEHDVTENAQYFTSVANAAKEIGVNRFSRLEDLSSDLFKSTSDEKYELMLEYPDSDSLKYFPAGTNATAKYPSNQNVTIDWSKNFALMFRLNIPLSSMSNRRLIFGNHKDGKIESFNIELTDTNKLRVYIDGKVDAKSTQSVHAGEGVCVFNYDHSSNQFVCTLQDAKITGTVERDSTLSANPDTFKIGANDNRGVSPFREISCTLLSRNIWKQSANPIASYKASSGVLSGYEDVAIGMAQYWGQGAGNSNYNCKGLGKNTSDNPDSFLDTMPGDNYWFGGLGQSAAYNGGFPAPDGTIHKHVCLWVRVDNTPFDGHTAIAPYSNLNVPVVLHNNYIDTGVTLTNDSRVVCEFKCDSYANNDCYVFGQGESGAANRFECYPWDLSSDSIPNQLQFNLGSQNDDNFWQYDPTKITKIDFSSKKCLINNVDQGTINKQDVIKLGTYNTCLIGAIYRPTSAKADSNGALCGNKPLTIYDFKIYEKEELVYSLRSGSVLFTNNIIEGVDVWQN